MGNIWNMPTLHSVSYKIPIFKLLFKTA